MNPESDAHRDALREAIEDPQDIKIENPSGGPTFKDRVLMTVKEEVLIPLRRLIYVVLGILCAITFYVALFPDRVPEYSLIALIFGFVGLPSGYVLSTTRIGEMIKAAIS